MSKKKHPAGVMASRGPRAWAVGGCAVIVIGLASGARAQNGSLLQSAEPMQHAPLAGVAQTSASLASQPNLAPQMGLTSQAGPGPQATLAPPPGATSESGAPRGYPPRSQYGSEAISLSGASWTYVPPPPVRSYQKNDIVTIRVDELSRMQAEGNAETRRNGLYDAVLKDWIALKGLDVRPSSQSDGDPRVQGTVNQLYRADSSLESRESLSFNIAARIVDIRPNGDLVLEARKTILFNGNAWETALSGICRATDIAPDNVVLSRDLLDLDIRREDRGRVRDGYRRGWFTRWFDTFSPF